MNNSSGYKNDAYAALKIPSFRTMIIARLFLTLSIQMQSVIVGWQIYEITHDVLTLGMIGLAEALPFIAVALFAGYWADKFNRKKIITIMVFLYLLVVFLLFLLSNKLSWMLVSYGVFPLFFIIAVTGVVRSAIYPAYSALLTQLVPGHLYSNASVWGSISWHIGSIAGPAAGGLIYGFAGKEAAYLSVVCLVTFSLILFFFIHGADNRQTGVTENLIKGLKDGFRFVFKNQILISSMSIDMFAVLFGGAVAMLPVFADTILHTGPEGLGILRAAPAIGAVAMSFWLAYRPPVHRSGRKLIYTVILFGIATIFFALSTNFILSVFLLFLTGVFDNVSVIIRQTIIQLYTPNEMRGRVSSINSIFIGSSNEIGSFESGVAARLMGLVPSVIFGGAATVFISGLIGKIAPRLYRLNLNDALKKQQ